MIVQSTVYKEAFNAGSSVYPGGVPLGARALSPVGVRAALCAMLLILVVWHPLIAKAAPVTANAAVPSSQTLIYNGDSSSKAAISVGPWGGGTASIETSSDTQNGAALKINSKDFYQGGVVTLKNPVTLPQSDSKHNWYLFVNLKVVQTAPDGSEASSLQPVPMLHMADYTVGGPQITLAQYGVPNQGAVPTHHRRHPATTPQAPGQYPGYNANPNATYSPDVPIVIPTVRLQLTLADGSSTDIERDLPAGYTQAPDEWMRIGVPLAALKFPNGVTGPLQKITIGGIPAGEIWISQIGLVQDNAPITASAGPDQDVSKGDDVSLSATADGGLAGLHYSWTFRAHDGAAEEASGPSVTTSYNSGGTDYKVTLVVSDVDGIKQPVTVTTTVKVEE